MAVHSERNTNGDKWVLVIGASSAIAKACIIELISRAYEKLDPIYLVTVSQQKQMDNETCKLIETCSLITHHHFKSDYSEKSIFDIMARIAAMMKQDQINYLANIEHIIICNGALHGQLPQDAFELSDDDSNISQSFFPEKSLSDFNELSFMHLMRINCVVPSLWLRALLPVLSKQNTRCNLTVLSARIGSIEDNHLGGWYSYRTSKAALNMMLKTASIEYARKAKHINITAFHPGTTDTALSKPFQANVPKGKLFTTEFVAKQLFSIIPTLRLSGQAHFIDYQGNKIPW